MASSPAQVQGVKMQIGVYAHSPSEINDFHGEELTFPLVHQFSISDVFPGVSAGRRIDAAQHTAAA